MMKWVPCEPSETLLGEREGHCACTLLSNSDPVEEWVVCIGGFCEGELSNTALIANVKLLPGLAWQSTTSSSLLERDGATLTGFGNVAYLFGGLDADIELTNELIEVRLTVSDDASIPQVSAAVVTCATGAIPPPRSRHAAGGCISLTDTNNGASHLYIFGGETESAPASNDLYALDLSTMVWRVFDTNLGPLPAPRFLTTSLVFPSETEFVMYGGAYFDDHNDQRSLADVWLFDTSSSAWTCLSPDSKADGNESMDVFPRSNGHGGALLDAGSIVFLGGKDGAEGCNAVKEICLKNNEREKVAFHVTSVPCDGADGPHYRYTPAVVSTSKGILLLAGQCRHPSPVESFLLTL